MTGSPAWTRRPPRYDGECEVVPSSSSCPPTDAGRAAVADHELVPLPVTRVANTLPGWLVVAFSLAPAAAAPWTVNSGLAVIGVAAGLALAVRGYRVGVRLTPEQVVVNGYLWTRRIKREDIRAVTDFPAIIWSSGSRRALGGHRCQRSGAAGACPHSSGGLRSR